MKIRLTILSLIAVLFASCEREFDNNADFKHNEQADVFGDNNLLFNKIFQFTTGGAYLWFDIRNEVANFSRPRVNLTYVLNADREEAEQMTMIKQVDLRGRLYSYNNAKEELTILDYPLDFATRSDLPADIVFSFARKQKDGCDMISDPGQRMQCERTFVLKIKRIEFKDIDFVMPVETVVRYDLRTMRLKDINVEVLLTN